MNKQDVEFLKQLQEKMNSGDRVGQAFPRYWAIMDYGYHRSDEDSHDQVRIFDIHAAEMISLFIYAETMLDLFVEGEEVPDTAMLQQAVQQEDESEIIEWYKMYNFMDYELIYEQEHDYIVWSTLFLTKEDAEAHLKSNHYHYSSKAHPFAMTVQRSPDVERLFHLLAEADWESIKDGA